MKLCQVLACLKHFNIANVHTMLTGSMMAEGIAESSIATRNLDLTN